MVLIEPFTNRHIKVTGPSSTYTRKAHKNRVVIINPLSAINLGQGRILGQGQIMDRGRILGQG